MSFEVEVKYRSVDHDHLIRELTVRGASAAGTVDMEDLYLSHPSRDFAQTHEAFRIRRIGDRNRITYKGPRRAGPTKTREEIEVPFEPGQEHFNQLLKLFQNLGFRQIAMVRKRRESYHLNVNQHPLEIALDTAENLGVFAEIEAFAESESALSGAQSAVLSLAAQLGLTEVEPRSYLRMILEWRSQETQSDRPGAGAGD